MVASDVLIFDSPKYCYEMSGQLKTLFDHYGYIWMSHRPRKEMFTKIGVGISTVAGGGAKKVTKSITKQLMWWGIGKMYQLLFNVNASSWKDVKEKKKQN